MSIREYLLTQFDLEVALTRKTLERVPLNNPDWKPHDRSMTLGWLATFLARLWSWQSHCRTDGVCARRNRHRSKARDSVDNG